MTLTRSCSDTIISQTTDASGILVITRYSYEVNRTHLLQDMDHRNAVVSLYQLILWYQQKQQIDLPVRSTINSLKLCNGTFATEPRSIQKGVYIGRTAVLPSA